MTQLNFKARMKNDERKPQSLPLTISWIRYKIDEQISSRTCFVREYYIRLRCVSLSYIFLLVKHTTLIKHNSTQNILTI